MGSKDVLMEVNETEYQVSVTIKKPQKRYIDEFMSLTCAPDLLEYKLFPNAKEITESFAAYNAVRRHLWKQFPPGDEDVHLFSVGDGSTPRTAGLFAFRSKWTCWSIDPAARWSHYRASKIRGLQVVPKKIEEANLPIYPEQKRVLVAVHSHADLQVATDIIMPHAVIAMPCCFPQDLERGPDIEYADWGIWSPERTIKIWKEI